MTFDSIKGVLGSDTTLCDKTELALDVGSFGSVVGWQDNSTSPTYIITRPGTYWVKMNLNNCLVTDSLSVAFCDSAIQIPNIITPNGDSFNERFEVKGIEFNAWTLTIFDRDGQKVYQNNSYANDWTGVNLIDGVYYFSLKHNHLSKFYKGWVQIRR